MGYLTDAEHDRVSKAVSDAELHSAGEIVTIIADRSDGYTDIALAWSALAGFAMIVLMALFPRPFVDLWHQIFGGWGDEPTAAVLFAMAGALGTVAFLAMYALMLPDSVRFATIPGRIKTERALDRAIDLFKAAAERRTHGRTGIVIYLSMQEHRAEIVADEAIASKVSPETWGDAMAAMLEHLKDDRVADGMVAAVGKVGAVLAEHFPRDEDDQNELPDRLIEL